VTRATRRRLACLTAKAIAYGGAAYWAASEVLAGRWSPALIVRRALERRRRERSPVKCA
jgi:hypothetical protein